MIMDIIKIVLTFITGLFIFRKNKKLETEKEVSRVLSDTQKELTEQKNKSLQEIVKAKQETLEVKHDVSKKQRQEKGEANEDGWSSDTI